MMNTADKLFAGAFTLALIAVLVGKSSKTSSAISAFGTMVTTLVTTAMGPLNSSNSGVSSQLSGVTSPLVQSGQNLANAGAALAGNVNMAGSH